MKLNVVEWSGVQCNVVSVVYCSVINVVVVVVVVVV